MRQSLPDTGPQKVQKVTSRFDNRQANRLRMTESSDGAKHTGDAKRVWRHDDRGLGSAEG